MPPTIAKSAKYPRVAVLLGVPKKWYMPLLLCRSLSTVFALWWAVTTTRNIWAIVGGGDVLDDGSRRDRGVDGVLSCLTVAQLGLAYLWAFTSAYLSHLFAASLMSRWLLHYSPLPVLVRLCALSVILSYILMQAFTYAGTTTLDLNESAVSNLERLSNSFPLWVCFHVTLLLGYFSTQQDISVEQDKDDRRRRLVLRMKCLTTLAVTSTASLMILLVALRLEQRDMSLNMSNFGPKTRHLVRRLFERPYSVDHEL